MLQPITEIQTKSRVRFPIQKILKFPPFIACEEKCENVSVAG